MTLDNIEECTFESALIHRIEEIEREGDVENLAETEGGIGFPERHLCQRQRRGKRARFRRLRLCGCCGFEAGRLFCKRRGGGVAEQVVETHFDAVIAQKASDDAGGDQRMAAKIEEIVIRSHVWRRKRFAEFGKDRCGSLVVAGAGGGGQGCCSLRPCGRGLMRKVGKIRAAFEMGDETFQQECRRMRRGLLAAGQFQTDVAINRAAGSERQAKAGLERGSGRRSNRSRSTDEVSADVASA